MALTKPDCKWIEGLRICKGGSLRFFVSFVFVGLFFGTFVAGSAEAYVRKPYIIMVGGGSASGKTFIAKKIVEALGSRAVLLSADNYFAPHKQPKEFYRGGQINYDHPSAVDLKKLALHLMYLKSGFAVQIEEYTFGRPVDQPHVLTHEPAEFIVVEGIFALYPDLAEHADFKVFVDVDAETRLRRRIARDVKERQIDEAEVRRYFAEVVEPMHQRYIQPSALYADVVVTSPDDRAKVDEIVRSVSQLAQQNRSTKYDILQSAYDQAISEILFNSEDNRDLRIFSFEDMFPTQEEIGFNRLAVKSADVNKLVFESSVAFDLPSRLKDYLLKNPIPVVVRNGRFYAADHHHLAMALSLKGIKYFLVQIMPDDYPVDEWRLRLIDRSGPPLTWEGLRNNPYRSLVSHVMEHGHIKKTGRPHQEFTWADHLKVEFERLGRPLTEEVFQDPDLQAEAIHLAIRFARSQKAKHLEGYMGALHLNAEACSEVLKKP